MGQFLRCLQELLRPHPSKTPGCKIVNLFERVSLEKRELLGSPASQGCLGKCFPGLNCQALRDYYSHGPRCSWSCSHWQQTLALSMWCWLCRHGQCKRFCIMEASTEISKGSLEARQCVTGSESLYTAPEGTVWSCEVESLNYSGNPRMLEKPGTWTIYWEKWQEKNESTQQGGHMLGGLPVARLGGRAA
jgi:hypothetical protein